MSTLDENVQKLDKYISAVRNNGIQNRINGKVVDASNGATFDNYSPVDEAFICKVAKGTASDVDAAAIAAREAFPPGAIWLDHSERKFCMR